MKNTLILFLITVFPFCTIYAQPGGARRALQAAKRAAAHTPAASPAKKFPSTLRDHLSAKQKTSLYSSGEVLAKAMSKSSAKQLLNRRQAYQNEIRAMNEVLPRLLLLSEQSKPSELAWAKLLIQDNVINKTLSASLLTLLEKQDYKALVREISSYYAIPLERDLLTLSNKDLRETVAQSALDYAMTHQHKPNLPLRELLKSYKVSPRTKEHLRKYLAVPEILHKDPQGFKAFVRTAHTQHQKGLRQAVSATEVREAIRFYQVTMQELRVFTQKYHRQPRWNAPLKERELYNSLQLILVQNGFNTFYEAEMLKRQIRDILNDYPARSFRAFEEDLKSFYAAYKRLPQSLDKKPHSSERERALYSDMLRFTMQGLFSPHSYQ